MKAKSTLTYDIQMFFDYENEINYNLPVYIRKSLITDRPLPAGDDPVEGHLWIQGIPEFEDYINTDKSS